MALFSNDDINTLVAKANVTLYKLAETTEKDRWSKGDRSIVDQTDIIYDLKKAIEYFQTRSLADPTYQKVAGYLQHKIKAFAYDAVIPYFAEGGVVSSGSSTASAISGYQFFKQIIVGGSEIAGGATVYTNASLIGRYVQVYVDGILKPVGASGVESYTFNRATGTITWNYSLTTTQVVGIFTYIPSLSGWLPFDSFIVGAPGELAGGTTSYSDPGLIGRGVAVVLNGLLLPFVLEDALSVTINSLTGTITWNNPLSDGQAVSIYTY